MAMWRGTLFLAKGLREFTRGGYERASKHFDDAVMQRDLKGRVAVVTGANQGLGYQTSLELARRGATLFMLCRNQERGSVAVDRVRQESGNQDVHLQVRAVLHGGGWWRLAGGARGSPSCPPGRPATTQPVPMAMPLMLGHGRQRRCATCRRCSRSRPLQRPTSPLAGRSTSWSTTQVKPYY